MLALDTALKGLELLNWHYGVLYSLSARGSLVLIPEFSRALCVLQRTNVELAEILTASKYNQVQT